MINLYAFNICDTLKHNGFVIDFIDFIYVLSSIVTTQHPYKKLLVNKP